MVTDRKPDAALPTAQRVEDLLERMTLEEKLAQLGSVWAFHIAKDGAFDPERVARVIEHNDPDLVALQEVELGIFEGGGWLTGGAGVSACAAAGGGTLGGWLFRSEDFVVMSP